MSQQHQKIEIINLTFKDAIKKAFLPLRTPKLYFPDSTSLATTSVRNKKYFFELPLLSIPDQVLCFHDEYRIESLGTIHQPYGHTISTIKVEGLNDIVNVRVLSDSLSFNEKATILKIEISYWDFD